ncbi:MAG: NAD(P)-dependent alcohol dehydrogenase [Hyphomonadaceae bacterium]|nr:NAD(P)-dependent alcohol dehydrogenase [Hyphomonadaceae bacterium]
MKITAAVASAPQAPFEIRELELDAPREDEILVKIKAVGICHTDLVARDQFLPVQLPAVLGHEGAGIVEQVGSAVTKVKPGDHVVLTFRSCQHCSNCDAHRPTYCETSPVLNYIGRRPDGSVAIHDGDTDVSSNFFGQSSFASHALAYESNTILVDKDVPFEMLAPLGCGVQTGIGTVLRSLKCAPGSTVAILGAGSVGLSAVIGAKLAECATIIVSDPVESRRELALELGATHAIDPLAGEYVEAIRAICPNGVEAVIDTTGVPAVLANALKALRPNGTLALVGVPSNPATPTPGIAAEVITYGHKVQGVIEGDSDPDSFIPQLVEFYKQGRLPLEKLVTTYEFNDIARALDDQHSGKCVKPVLVL